MLKRKERKMLKRGIEPQTFALLARRSNQLSYSSLLCSLPYPLRALLLPFSPPFLTNPRTPMQRVVITGIGAITPFGVGMEHCFQQIVAGRSGIVVVLGKQLLIP